MRANGYGADLEVDADTVTIHAGKAAAKLQRTPTIRIPVGDIAEVAYRAASMMVNGSMRFTIAGDPGTGTLRTAASGDVAATAQAMAFDQQLQGYGADQPNTVNRQSLVVHWRKKDEAAFAALRDLLAARVPIFTR